MFYYIVFNIFITMKKLVFLLSASVAVTLLGSVLSLNAKRVNCIGNDPLRGGFECTGITKALCVSFSSSGGSVECNGKRVYSEPLIIEVGPSEGIDEVEDETATIN